MRLFYPTPASHAGPRHKSHPSSRVASPPSPRRSSPSPAGHSSILDSINIDGNLYDVLKPRPAPAHVSDLFPKELHVILRYTVSFTLSQPVYAESITATFTE